jgi:hypothetical protein
MKDYTAIQERMKQLDDPWYTHGETHLDLSGCATYRPTTIEQDDGFHVPLADQNHHGSREGWAKQAVLDPEIIQTLANTPNRTADEDALLQHYQDPAFSFHTSGYKVSAKWDKGTWLCVAVNEETDERNSFKLGGHTKTDKEAVMTHATRYLVPKKPWRELTEEELIVVSRMASGGNLRAMESAVWTYLNYALPGIDRDVSLEKAYQPLCDSICWFVFRHAHIGIDDEAEDWMRDRLGDRAVTINSLCGVYELWQHERNKHSRSLLFNPPEPEPETPESVQESLDNLSDEELADLRQQTIRLAFRR